MEKHSIFAALFVKNGSNGTQQNLSNNFFLKKNKKERK
jgi:hypothetical protein